MLEDKGDEADKLMRRIEDLERQLNKEEENCKRFLFFFINQASFHAQLKMSDCFLSS